VLTFVILNIRETNIEGKGAKNQLILKIMTLWSIILTLMEIILSSFFYKVCHF